MWFPDVWQLIARWTQVAIEREQHSRAERLARWFVRLHSRDERAWIIWSNVASFLGDEKRAETILRRGLTHVPASVRLGREIGRSLIDQNRHAEAEGYLESLHERYPDSPLPLLELARLAANEDKFDKLGALGDKIETRITTENQAEVLMELGRLLLRVPQQRERGRSMLEKSARIERHSLPHLTLAILDEAEGLDPREHLRLARKYWRGPPGSFENHLAATRYALGGLIRYGDEVARMNPTSANEDIDLTES